jgi:hypothetical protein
MDDSMGKTNLEAIIQPGVKTSFYSTAGQVHQENQDYLIMEQQRKIEEAVSNHPNKFKNHKNC